MRPSNHLSHTDYDGERRLQCVLVHSDKCIASAVSTYVEFINSILSYYHINILSLTSYCHYHIMDLHFFMHVTREEKKATSQRVDALRLKRYIYNLLRTNPPTRQSVDEPFPRSHDQMLDTGLETMTSVVRGRRLDD